MAPLAFAIASQRDAPVAALLGALAASDGFALRGVPQRGLKRRLTEDFATGSRIHPRQGVGRFLGRPAMPQRGAGVRIPPLAPWPAGLDRSILAGRHRLVWRALARETHEALARCCGRARLVGDPWGSE